MTCLSGLIQADCSGYQYKMSASELNAFKPKIEKTINKKITLNDISEARYNLKKGQKDYCVGVFKKQGKSALKCLLKWNSKGNNVSSSCSSVSC